MVLGNAPAVWVVEPAWARLGVEEAARSAVEAYGAADLTATARHAS
jgi:hypothetical protein